MKVNLWRIVLMTDDLLNKCVIDTSKRTVYLYSDGGDKKTVKCDTVDEFMNVLSFVRGMVEEERVFYSDPL
jgi:imidazoleglycerol phosphate dehydratase HisB